MSPLLLALAAVCGTGAGWAVRTWLERGSWRRPGEEAARLPRLRWEPVAAGVLWPVLLHRVDAVGHPAAWPALAVLVLMGVAMASIDLAVHRLPDLFTLRGLPVVAGLLAAASWVEGSAHGLATMAWSAAVATVVMVVLGLGGLGLGDVKLGVLLAAALGWFGMGVAALGLMAGFVLGGLWAGVLLLTRRASAATRFAYGPWMLLGALVPLLVGLG